VIAVPPFDAGAVNAILICLFPGVTESTVGAPGTFHVVAETAVELVESPKTLVARNKTLYSVLLLNPLATMGEIVDDASINAAPFNEYLYVVIAVPPLVNGGVNAILICLFPGVTESTAGIPGTVHVVAETEDELVESPIALVARNKTLYSVLLLNPLTTMGEIVDDASINAAPFNEYLYVVIAVPPLLNGGVNAILICLFPGVTDEIVGASGVVHVVAETADELSESPTTDVARSKTLYNVLSVRPVTINGIVVLEASTNDSPFNEYLYVVISEPPLFAGGTNTILICLFPPVTDEMVGASGTAQVIAATAVELDESPKTLVARSKTLYDV
jgi:hypothetical protein